MTTKNEIVCHIDIRSNKGAIIEEDIVGKVKEMTSYKGVGNRITHYLTIIEDKNECDDEKEDNMTVKIKKEPREVTIEELKEMDEFKKIIVKLDQAKLDDFEEKYGKPLYNTDEFVREDGEIKFTKYCLVLCSKYYEAFINYDMIEKIEVVEL